MVIVFASSSVDRGFESRSGQTKDFEIGICCFSAKHESLRAKSGWLWIMIMCPSGAACLSVDCGAEYLSVDCWVGRHVYPRTVEWSDISIRGLLSGATCLSTDCWVGRHVYPWTVEWGDMSIHGLLSGVTCLSVDCWVGWHVYPWTVVWVS
jgi:hypothetical protein